MLSTNILVQLIRLVVKHGDKRISSFAKERWLEMGMSTFTVAVYTLPNEQVAVTR